MWNSHKLGGRLPLLSTRPAVILPTLRGLLPILLLGEHRHNGCEQFACPKTVTQQRRSCDLNPGPSAPESSKLTTRLPNHQPMRLWGLKFEKDFSFSFSLSLVKLSLFLWSFQTSTSNCVLIKCNKWNKVNIIKTAWMQSASTRKPETKLCHKNNKHRIKTSRC